MESRAPCNLYETTATGCRLTGAARDASRFTLSVCALAELNYPSRSRDGMRRDTAGLDGGRWDITFLSLSLFLLSERASEEAAIDPKRLPPLCPAMAIRCDKRTREVYAPWRMRDFFPRRGEFIQRQTEKLISPSRASGRRRGTRRRARREDG